MSLCERASNVQLKSQRTNTPKAHGLIHCTVEFLLDGSAAYHILFVFTRLPCELSFSGHHFLQLASRLPLPRFPPHLHHQDSLSCIPPSPSYTPLVSSPC